MSQAALRYWTAAFCGSFLILSGWADLSAQNVKSPRKPQDTLAVIHTLKVSLEMETHLLGIEMAQYMRLEEKRIRLGRSLEILYEDLNRLLQDPEDLPPEEIAAKESEVSGIEQGEIDVRRSLRESRQRIRRGRERIKFLRGRMETFRVSLPPSRESLTGTWEVVYLPTGDRGIFQIEQDGTLLGGKYGLEGGWTGSLQGTFVNGKVFLERIDSKLGRSSEIRGYISSDGKSIKGSWQNFDLSGPGPSTGAWSATKREPSSEAEARP